MCADPELGSQLAARLRHAAAGVVDEEKAGAPGDAQENDASNDEPGHFRRLSENGQRDLRGPALRQLHEDPVPKLRKVGAVAEEVVQDQKPQDITLDAARVMTVHHTRQGIPCGIQHDPRARRQLWAPGVAPLVLPERRRHVAGVAQLGKQFQRIHKGCHGLAACHGTPQYDGKVPIIEHVLHVFPGAVEQLPPAPQPTGGVQVQSNVVEMDQLIHPVEHEGSAADEVALPLYQPEDHIALPRPFVLQAVQILWMRGGWDHVQLDQGRNITG